VRRVPGNRVLLGISASFNEGWGGMALYRSTALLSQAGSPRRRQRLQRCESWHLVAEGCAPGAFSLSQDSDQAPRCKREPAPLSFACPRL